MEDAVLLTELAQIIISGIKRRDSRLLNRLYSENDDAFSQCDIVRRVLVETLDFIKVELNDILASEAIKPYMFYSLAGALIYNKYGIEGVDPAPMWELL
jgi:predicted component of type VI protein secretion system